MLSKRRGCQLDGLDFLILALEPIHRRVLVVLGSNLGTGEVEVMVHHLKSGVPQYFLQAENVAAVEQVVYGKCMAAEGCV